MSYSLQKYKGRSTRHTCPACGRSRCFAYYVNEDGKALDRTVGRCDHQNSCGYHLKPREFFEQHPGLKVPESWKEPAKEVERKLWIIWKDHVKQYRSDSSTLVSYLYAKFDPDKVKRAAALYQLGATVNGSTVFWQIDIEGRARTAKVMAYGEDGHRVKDATCDRVTWIHSILKKESQLPDEFELTQCFFGEHLLNVFPSAPVVIVESEKTAVICAIMDDSRVYLATGGKYGLNGDRCAVLKGRKVTVIPDADAIDEWADSVKDLQRFYDIHIGDPGYTEDDKANKRDIADLILINKQI